MISPAGICSDVISFDIKITISDKTKYVQISDKKTGIILKTSRSAKSGIIDLKQSNSGFQSDHHTYIAGLNIPESLHFPGEGIIQERPNPH
jgi:hypothetical protein